MRTSARFGSVILLTALLVHGCHKDELTQDFVSSPDPTLFGNTVLLTVGGQVMDEQGVPVAGATVVSGFSSHSTITDGSGVFKLTNISGYSDLGYIKVSKPGYFHGSRSFLPVSGTNTVRITLLASTLVGSVQASTGGTVSGEGVVLTLPAGTYTQNGTPFTGTISVTLNHIDPASEALSEQMPGELIGTMDGSARLLRSFGMVAVGLSDGSGNEVEISEGGTATVEFPIPASMQSEAPATIDLWYFDEEAGVWRKEGEAQLQGNAYVAQVGHFSWWNCDAPNTFVHLEGRVADATTAAAVSGARVVVQSQSAGTGTTFTNDQGYYGGMVPDAQSLTITVSIPCGQGNYEQVHQQTLSGLTQAHVLNIPVLTSSVSMVQGTLVDCDNNPVTAGYVMAGSMVHFCSNGQFNFSTCVGSMELTGVDQGNFTASVPQTLVLSGGSYEVGSVQACGDPISSGGVTDINGYTYTTVLIGTQEWMAENLRVSNYANGDPIPVVNDGVQWTGLSTDAVTWWGAEWDAEYGKLYNWYAVSDPRNVCPSGWHVPSDSEWKQLESALGMPAEELDQTGQRGEAANVGGKMKVLDGWDGLNVGATNESGFSAVPSGIRSWAGNLALLHSDARYWTATEMAPDKAWIRDLARYYASIYRDNYNNLSDKRNGLAVRCVRD